jgi:hypothetical protein
MKQYTSYLITALCAVALGVTSASAQGKGKGKDKSKGKPPTSSPNKPHKGPSKDKGSSKDKKNDKGPSKDNGKNKKDDKWRVDSKFKSKDRDDLLSFWDKYKGDDHGLPPGLAKNLRRGKPLPPGWQDKVKSGWKIEDDWWDRFDRVPGDYLPKEFKLPKDTGMFLLGDRLVRVHEPSREVVDFVRIPSIKR